MDWIQTGSIIGTILVSVGGAFKFLYTEIKGYRNEMKEENKLFREEIAHQVKRSDRLYEMFIDLVKERK